MTPSDSKKLVSLGDGFLRTLRDRRKPTVGFPWWVLLLCTSLFSLLGVARNLVLGHTADPAAIQPILLSVVPAHQEPAFDSAAAFRAGDIVPNTVEEVKGGVCRFRQDVFVTWQPDGQAFVAASSPDLSVMTCRPFAVGEIYARGMPTTFYALGAMAELEEGTDI